MDVQMGGTLNALLAAAVKNAAPQTQAATIQKDDTQTGSNESEAASVEISDDGKTLLSTLDSFMGVKSGEAITIEDMKSFADQQLQAFEREFKALLRDNNIDTSVPVKLGHEYGSGKVIVQGSHPDADKIESLLSDRPDLCNTYSSATGALSLARNAEEYVKFGNAYEKNPRAAVAQYSYLFNMQWDAEVTFENEGYEVSYNHTVKR